jgi:hypothetical protein
MRMPRLGYLFCYIVCLRCIKMDKVFQALLYVTLFLIEDEPATQLPCLQLFVNNVTSGLLNYNNCPALC